MGVLPAHGVQLTEHPPHPDHTYRIAGGTSDRGIQEDFRNPVYQLRMERAAISDNQALGRRCHKVDRKIYAVR